MVLGLAICLLLGWLMVKYTSQDVKSLAMQMRVAADEGRPFAVLMGAGCSISAGIPSAEGLIKHINGHPYGAIVRDRLSCTSLVGQDYGVVMGSLVKSERKTVLEPLLASAKINWGHIALACLMKAKLIGRSLTFNFDSVLAKAAGISGLYPATYDFGVSPADTFEHIVTPSILHLHGQGHGLAMMNSSEETESHALKLKPLFEDTLQKFDALVIGYSAKADKAFPHFAAAFNGQHRLWWCEHSAAAVPDHVRSLLEKEANTSRCLQGVDFDEFMIALAQELKCFPPKLFRDPAQHLLEDINPIIEPPKELRGAAGLLPRLKLDLKKWSAKTSKSVSSKLANAMLSKDWNGAIALESKILTSDDMDSLALAYVGKGNQLQGLAEEARDESIYKKAIACYEMAIRWNSREHRAYYNWGCALDELATLQQNKSLLEQAQSKFVTALEIKPDFSDALANLANIEIKMYYSLKDRAILKLAEQHALEAQKISKKAEYNLACAYALQGRENECRLQLFACLEDGEMPNRQYLEEEADFSTYREMDWFKELLAKLTKP
jgi:tetratricopeptide (TPR) repeat protein